MSVSPKEIFVGGGLWHPEADKLLRVRRFIGKHGAELEKIVNAKKFKQTFGEISTEDTLKRVPRGFEADHPFAEFIKLKSFVASKDFSPQEALEKSFGQKIDKALRDLKPFNEFLKKGLE